MIKVFVFRKENGLYKYEDLGNPENVIRDLGDELDFTLVPPPVGAARYRWNGESWELPEGAEDQTNTL